MKVYQSSIILALVYVCSSCVVPQGHVLTLTGNYDFLRGAYQESMLAYLAIPGSSSATSSNSHGLYNLGNTYYMLGENEIALSVWEQALEGADDGLRFYIIFNKGLVYFEAGNFAKALELFTECLTLRPDDADVRVNLELSYLNLRALEGLETRASQPVIPGTLPESQERLLEYVRRREASPIYGRGDGSVAPRQGGLDW